MKHKEYYWLSDDDTKLFAQSWEPEEHVKAVICLVHGLGDHSGRYANWAGKFVNQGYAVLGIDLRGHGRSGGKRGCAGSYARLLDDVGILVKKAHKLYPKKSRILYGHSMGGNLSLYYRMKRRSGVEALVITSPWLKLSQEPTQLLQMFAKFISLVWPRFTTQSTVKKEQLTHQAEIIEKLQEDQYIHNRVSPRLYFEVSKAGDFILKNKHKINVPLLLLHGDQDQVTSYYASKKMAKNTSMRTTIKICEGCFHELHNEIDSQLVFDHIIKWMDTLKTIQKG